MSLNPNAKEFAFTGGRKGKVAVYKASITDDLKGVLQSSPNSRCYSYNTSTKSSKYLPFQDCQTVEELVQLMYDHLQTSATRNFSAFWSFIPQLLRKSRFEKVHNIEQMNHQLEDILCHTYKISAHSVIEIWQL